MPPLRGQPDAGDGAPLRAVPQDDTAADRVQGHLRAATRRDVWAENQNRVTPSRRGLMRVSRHRSPPVGFGCLSKINICIERGRWPHFSLLLKVLFTMDTPMNANPGGDAD